MAMYRTRNNEGKEKELEGTISNVLLHVLFRPLKSTDCNWIPFMQAIVLAAGFGTRLRPYTLIRPKPLFPVLNRPLLHRLLDMLYAAGCDKIIVNGHHLANQICDSLKDYPDVHLQVEEEILGTGGSLRLAKDSLSDEPILVMNGDIFHTVDVAALYEYHCDSGNDVTMAMHDYPRFNTVGVQGDKVVSFCPEQKVPQLAFTGIHVVEAKVIEQIPSRRFFHIIDLYQELAVQGRIGLQRVDGAFWRDIGTPEDYLQLHRELLDGSAGIELAVADHQEGAWILGKDVQLGDNVQLHEWGSIGNGVQIGDSVMLQRSVVWGQARIPAGSHIVDTIVTGDEGA